MKEEWGEIMHDNLSKKFLWVTAFNVIITVVEFIGGIISGSLALLSDAIHNLGDAGAILLSFFAHLLSRRDRDTKKTFGYQRAEVLAAFTNAILLLAISFFLIVEAIGRFSHPTQITGNLMLIVSIIGLLGNFISMIIMHQDSKNNLNVKSTFLHMMSDAVSSIGVIFAAIAIKFFDAQWLDPVMTIFVAILVLREAIKIVISSVNILMESNPQIDLAAVQKTILEIPEIKNLHHVHIWQLSDNQIMMDAHLNVDRDLSVVELEHIYDKLSHALYNKFKINHVTFQAECQRGIDEKMIENDKKD